MRKTFNDVLNDIENNMIDVELSSISGNAAIFSISEIDYDNSNVVLNVQDKRKTWTFERLEKVWNEMYYRPAANVEIVFGGSGSSRNQVETIYACLPYVEWLYVNSKKCVAYIGEETHSYGTLKRMDNEKEQRYQKLMSLPDPRNPLLHPDEVENHHADMANNVNYETKAKGGINKIFYGAPGCGKSRHVADILKNANVPNENIVRVTFHPEYANCDYIGQIMPTVETESDGKEIVKYIFNPGPFTLALLKAYNTTTMVYLIVEEINRGNAAAIFGDMFQLLDRIRDIDDPNFSSSEYPISNPNMQKYLIENTNNFVVKTMLENGIFIPSNLTIFATMNSSDQNVFTLDTAFKRRWHFEQISNDITRDTQHAYKNWFIPGTNVTWEVFLTLLNNKILEYKIHSQTNEDKRLGKYFVTKECLTEEVENITDVQDLAMEFAYKVLEYVWNDVCKIGREEWFDTERYKTLEELIDAFVNPCGEDTPLSIFQNINF